MQKRVICVMLFQRVKFYGAIFTDKPKHTPENKPDGIRRGACFRGKIESEEGITIQERPSNWVNTRIHVEDHAKKRTRSESLGWSRIRGKPPGNQSDHLEVVYLQKLYKGRTEENVVANYNDEEGGRSSTKAVT